MLLYVGCEVYFCAASGAGTQVGAGFGLDVGRDWWMSSESCVDVSAGSPHASEWLQTWSESSGMVAEVATEVTLEGWTLELGWALERKDRMYSFTLLMNDC